MNPTPPRSHPGDGTGSERAPGEEAVEPRESGDRPRPARPGPPVAVFQAARPPAGTARPAGPDIESPFLDLFGSSPAPVRDTTPGPPPYRPGERVPAARSPERQAPGRPADRPGGDPGGDPTGRAGRDGQAADPGRAEAGQPVRHDWADRDDRDGHPGRGDAGQPVRHHRADRDDRDGYPASDDRAGRTGRAGPGTGPAGPNGAGGETTRARPDANTAADTLPEARRTTTPARPADTGTAPAPHRGDAPPAWTTAEPRHVKPPEARRTPPETRRPAPPEARRIPPETRHLAARETRQPAPPEARRTPPETRQPAPPETRRTPPAGSGGPADPVPPGARDQQPDARRPGAAPARPSRRGEAARRKQAPRQDTRTQDSPAKDARTQDSPRRDDRRAEDRRREDRRREDRRAGSRPTAPARASAPARVPAPKPPKHKDRDPAVDLAIREIAGHLTFTHSSVTAWYWLPEVRWAFRPDAEREALMSAIAEQYAGLSGLRLHLRRTSRPFPADEWARTLDSYTPRPLPAVPDAPSWSDHLEAAQRHLLSMNHAEGQTYLGVTFARRSLGDTLGERLGRMFGRGTAEAERRRLARMVEQFDEVLGLYGMRGRRVDPGELEWLMYRSVALCMSPPDRLSPVSSGQWERGDLLALTEQVERYRTPYGSTVKLVNRMTGEERHVTVLTVGRMEPLEIPERHEPWLHFHERLPWPMELSSRVDVLGPGDSFRNLEHRLRMIRSQQLDYAEHGMDAPPELERLAQRALHIGDEMTTGLPTDASRVHGWHRIAVGGRTREECLERARRLIQVYSRELRISLQHPKNQDWLAREFIPGEPVANTGYVRRMPVNLFAAALPQAASSVGDRRGDLIGRTAGTSRRPVFLDLHFPMEVRERSGLAVFVAEPGGGKSTLMGGLGYLAARRGVQVTLLDPSGPLARLAQMPELKPYSRVLNLTGSEHGTLAPYALIPTPKRSEFAPDPAGEREHEIATSNARAERRMLVQDICSMLVPPQVAREASTATLLRHAARQVPAEETSTLDDIVKCLSDMDDSDAREVANLLMDTAEMPLAMLFFGRPPDGMFGSDDTLTVITMAGLRLPDLKIEREYWSAEEALALPMLHTAHRLAVRRCYGAEMGSRKLVGLDEAHFMEGWRSGRSFLVRLARDSRKWNLAALVASQNPKDILGLDVQNLVSTVFVGRIAEDPEVAAEALRMLRVPTGVGYEATLASLSQVDSSSSNRLGFREFVMRDVDGRVQKIRVDLSYVHNLLAQLDTTPAAGPAPAIARADEPEA